MHIQGNFLAIFFMDFFTMKINFPVIFQVSTKMINRLGKYIHKSTFQILSKKKCILLGISGKE